MSNIESIFPANDFRIVSKNAADDIEVGIIIGYSSDGELCIYGGGMIDGRQPVARDWLWAVETFKQKLINGDYFDGKT